MYYTRRGGHPHSQTKFIIFSQLYFTGYTLYSDNSRLNVHIPTIFLPTAKKKKMEKWGGGGNIHLPIDYKETRAWRDPPLLST